MKRFVLFSGLMGALLLAGCSQVVSTPLEDEESTDSDDIAVMESSSSHKASKSSSSGKSSSSVKSSNSEKSSNSKESSCSAKSSSSVKSSSSAASSSSMSSSSSAILSSSSKKVQPRLAEYPYYEYVSVPWSFGPRNPTPPYYDATVFNSVEYTWFDADEFNDSDWEWRQELYTTINVVEELAPNVVFLFYPTASKRYLLSFEPREGYSMPYLRVMVNGQDKYAVITGVAKDGRWYYPMDADSLHFTKESVKLVLTYGMKSRLYDQRWPNFILSDDGTGYPQEFDISLIVVGKYMGTSDSVSVDVLAERILERLNIALNPGGIKVRKANVLYAKDHPVYGSDFPESEPVVLYRDMKMRHVSIDSLAMWDGHIGEFSFVLGYYVDDQETEMAGFSPEPGNLFYYTKPLACAEVTYLMDYVVDCMMSASLVTHWKKGDKQFSSRDIASTALHELGHFFGLKHTSPTGIILNGDGTDGLSDTPACSVVYPVASIARECDDYGYMMFPQLTTAYEYATFTPQQMEIIRTYLSSTPHK